MWNERVMSGHTGQQHVTVGVSVAGAGGSVCVCCDNAGLCHFVDSRSILW